MAVLSPSQRGVTVEEREADEVRARPARRPRWPDALIAGGLGLVALLYRLSFPPDGFFFDDGWQAFGAIRGSFSKLLTVGQTQPGFGLVLMVWSRVVGAGTASMVTPDLIAGVIGPPALYLALRRFHMARSVSALLGAALVVCTADIVYSGRVKVYTFEVLVVLLVAVTLPWFAQRSWRMSTALGWFAVSMVLAMFSIFSLLATVAAAIVLVLSARNDLRLRLTTVAAQAVGVLAVLAAVSRTHDVHGLAAYFDHDDAYISTSLNPVTFARETFHHLTRITAVFPGGPAWIAIVSLAVATIGLATAAARGGSRSIAARFMVVMVLLAFIGSIAQEVPFGPARRASRLVLWMTPILAFGIAVVLQRFRRWSARRGDSWRRAFDCTAFAMAGLLLLTALGTTRVYPDGGAKAASRRAMQLMQPGDALLVSPRAMYSFALDSGTPVNVQAAPDRLQGLLPDFRDQRIHTVLTVSKESLADVDQAVKTAPHVVVVDSELDLPGTLHDRATLAKELQRLGFERAGVTNLNSAVIVLWRRA